MEKKILLVDDEASIRKVLSISLMDAGYEAVTAADGREALKLVHQHQPPIVLTDIKMPVMDGITLLGEIKAAYPEIEVIVVTGHGDMDVAIECLKRDATDFITKPIRDDALEIALNRAENKIQVRRELKTHQERLHELVKAELKATRQRYWQVFNEAPCYISVQDRHFNITANNRWFKEDFGEEIGQPCYRVYKHRQAPCPDCPVAKTFDDGQPHQAEMVVTSAAGEQYNVLIWTAPLYDANGELTEVMEMSTNITQIRQLQDHLTSLGMLIGSISHAIKGLLTGLDGGMYLLNSGFEKDDRDKLEEGWEVVKLMVGRIRSMVLDILYYAKKRDLQWERVEVLRFAEEVARIVEPKAQKNQIRFSREFDPAAGTFEIDAGVVNSALVNILENAVDACADDDKAVSHQIRFRVKTDAEHVILEVEDNGMGMEQETRENMFTLFFSSKGHRGTGLGLFISNRIIEQHGGHIDVESTPGKGSLFRIFMPKTLPESVKNGVNKESSVEEEQEAQ